MIREKTTEDLRHMTDEEGLILQGCGGDLQEWVDGINELLTQEGILLNGSKFENAATFQHDGLTNLLFSFEGSAECGKACDVADSDTQPVWRHLAVRLCTQSAGWFPGAAPPAGAIETVLFAD